MKKLLLFSLFLFMSALLQAQEYSFSLHLNDDNLSEKEFNRIVDYKHTHPSKARRTKEYGKLITQLRSVGNLNARFDSIIKIDSLKEVAYVSTGRTFEWGIVDKGNVDEHILRKTGFQDKLYNQKPIYYKNISRLMQRIIRHCENYGYPFASIKLDSVMINENIISAMLLLEKEQLYEIDSIIIKGNAKIKPIYIYNYLGIKPGDLYNESQIEKISARLAELPFVQEKDPVQAIFTDKHVKLYLHLDNKKASQFDGILGVLPDNATGKVVITGDLKIKLQNSFGRGEIVDVNWRKLQARTQDLKVNFVYPFLFSTPFGVDLKLELYKRDTFFLNLNRIIGIQFQLSGNNYIKAFYDGRSTNLLSVSAYENISSIDQLQHIDVNTNLYGLSYNLEKLDYRFNPRKGIALYASAGAGNKKIKKNARVPQEAYEGENLKTLQVNGELNTSFFLPIPNRSTLKIGLQSAYLYNQQLFENELYRIGGLRTLRGFDEESIFASSYAISTFEYRFLLEQNSYLSAFLDYAYYEKITSTDRIIDRPFGFGTGINFETKIGIFSLSYAIGKQFDNPIEIRSAKIHFGFVNRF